MEAQNPLSEIPEIDGEPINIELVEGITVQSIHHSARDGTFSKLEQVIDHFQRTSVEPKQLFGSAAVGHLIDVTKQWIHATCGNTNRTLLHWAARYKELQILKWILSESDGLKIPRQPSFVNQQDFYGFYSPSLGCEDNPMDSHEEIVKALFEHPDTEVRIAAENMLDCKEIKSTSNGLTALHFAAKNEYLSIAQLLVESQSMTEEFILANSTSLKTVLHYAVEGGNWKVVMYMLQALNRIKKREIVHECDLWRQTPLYLAASNENVEVVEILLREGRGLELNTVTWEGMTALDVAKRNEKQAKKKISEINKSNING